MHGRKKKRIFAAMKEEWLQRWRKYGKYVVTVAVFVVVMLFVGDQSLINCMKRAREIRHLEEQRDAYRAGIQRAQRELNALQNTDSLERFAREQYFMHADNEDVYLVEE